VDPRLAGNKRVEDSLKRLQQLVKNQYGKDLEIIPLSGVDGEANEVGSSSGDDLIIPVEINGERLGTAVVRQAAGLDKLSSLRLSDLVRLVLAPVLNGFAEDIRISLREIESTGKALAAENVIPLFNHVENSYDLIDLHPKIQNAEASALARQKASEKPLTINFQSLNPHKSYQAAIDVHEMVGSWAFLMWSDIKPRLKSIADLAKLGRCTVFISDVLDLEPEERDLIERFVKLQAPEMPVLVVGSRKSLITLVAEGLIDEGLAESLSGLTMNLDMIPQIKGALRDCVELLVAGELQPKA
jgi:hypothetical protein